MLIHSFCLCKWLLIFYLSEHYYFNYTRTASDEITGNLKLQCLDLFLYGTECDDIWVTLEMLLELKQLAWLLIEPIRL